MQAQAKIIAQGRKSFATAQKVLNNRRNWGGLTSNWFDKNLSAHHKAAITELCYRLAAHASGIGEATTNAHIDTLVLTVISGGDWQPGLFYPSAKAELEARAAAFKRYDTGSKPRLSGAMLAFITTPNPVIWVEAVTSGDESVTTIMAGDHLPAFLEALASDPELRAWEPRPVLCPDDAERPHPGRTINGIRTGVCAHGDRTLRVFEILERRSLWLNAGAVTTADGLTWSELSGHKWTHSERLRLNGQRWNKETEELEDIDPKAARGKAAIRDKSKVASIARDKRRQALLSTLAAAPTTGTRMTNRYYNQPSGRIQPFYRLHVSNLSERAGKSAAPVCIIGDKTTAAGVAFAGGVRQAVVSATADGEATMGSDQCASGWQLAALLLGDTTTMAAASAPSANFNNAATKAAIDNDAEHGFFLPGLADPTIGIKVGTNAAIRKQIKAVLMTLLYGSTPHQQYKNSLLDPESRIWAPTEYVMAEPRPACDITTREEVSIPVVALDADGKRTVTRSSGLVRFVEWYGEQFPVFKNYLELARAIAKVGCKKYGTFTLPYAFDNESCLTFDEPTCKTVSTARIVDGTRLDLKLTYPTAPVVDGRYAVADTGIVARQIAPLLIHSLDSTVIKEAVLVLDRVLPAHQSFGTIHDCLILPASFGQDRAQRVWNIAVRKAYRRFGRVLSGIVVLLESAPKEAGAALPVARAALAAWEVNVRDAQFMNNLWLSTEVEF